MKLLQFDVIRRISDSFSGQMDHGATRPMAIWTFPSDELKLTEGTK